LDKVGEGLVGKIGLELDFAAWIGHGCHLEAAYSGGRRAGFGVGCGIFNR
jgi:hypothetical protein